VRGTEKQMSGNKRRSITAWTWTALAGALLLCLAGLQPDDGQAVAPALPLSGDADCSGTIDLRDSLEIRRISAGLTVPGLCASDADGSGSTDAADALCVLQVLAGLAPACASPFEGFSVTFFDVGQGDAALVSVGGARMLIDSGPSGSVILQRLQSLGITDLDAIVATHLHADHIGGFSDILGAFAVERIYVTGEIPDSQTDSAFLGAAGIEPGAQVITPRRGDSISLGGVSFSVLHPVSLVSNSNDNSLVLGMTCGAVGALFMGDAEESTESSLLSAGVAFNADVLKVGHHGSNSSSTLAFLQVADPEVAVLSYGRTNQFDHPHQETLDGLGAIGASLVATDITAADDSVTMTSDCATYSFSRAPVPPVTSTPVGGATSTPTNTQTGSPTGTVTTTNTPTRTPTNTSTSTPTRTPTLTPTATSPSGTCSNATASITGLNKVTEIVSLTGSGDLTGWTLVSVTGNQVFPFPDGYTANGSFTVHSGTPEFANSQSQLWWRTANTWNNDSNDDAALFNCLGQQVDFFDDGL